MVTTSSASSPTTKALLTRNRKGHDLMKELDFSRIALVVAGIAPAYTHNVRVGGKIEFVKDQGPVRRDVRVHGFIWDADIHRNLAKTLWAIERGHSYGMAALRLFSKMNSSEFSPDGLLGGKGYIQQVREMRSGLSQAVEMLSSFSDTLHDEINADHWREATDGDPSTGKIVEEAQQVRENPEQYVEEAFHQEVPSAEEGEEFDINTANPSPDEYNPFPDDDEEGEDEEEGSEWDWDSIQPHTSSDKEVPLPGPKSELPTDDGEQEQGVTHVEMMMNTTGEHPRGNYAAAIKRAVEEIGRSCGEPVRREASFRRSGEPVRVADSSVDPATLPGPRVMNIGPGESTEENGGFSEFWDYPSDDPMGRGLGAGDYLYEGTDANGDGVTGYSDATEGDNTVLKMSSKAIEKLSRTSATYSWLPGSRNEKLMPYYDRSMSEDDVLWMQANDTPDLPAGMAPKIVKPPEDPLWDAARSKNVKLPSD